MSGLLAVQVLDRARLQRLGEQQLAGLVEGLEGEHRSQLAAESERPSSQHLGYTLDSGLRTLGETLPAEGVEGAMPTAELAQDPSQDTPGASGIVQRL